MINKFRHYRTLDNKPYKGAGKKYIKKIREGIFRNDIDAMEKDFLERAGAINWDKQYTKLLSYKSTSHNAVSPMWKDFFSPKPDIEVVAKQRASSTIGCVLRKGYDLFTTVLGNTRKLIGTLMCCDTPERTVGNLWGTFCDNHDVDLDRRLEFLVFIARYTDMQFGLAFYMKWAGRVGRPVHYEKQDLKRKNSRKSVQDIPHPNHPSAPSGHSTVGFAVLYAVQALHKLGLVPKPKEEWVRMCKEVGLARYWLGIHYLADHKLAEGNVKSFHEKVLKYTQA